MRVIWEELSTSRGRDSVDMLYLGTGVRISCGMARNWCRSSEAEGEGNWASDWKTGNGAGFACRHMKMPDVQPTGIEGAVQCALCGRITH